jgi:hypothetical protein
MKEGYDLRMRMVREAGIEKLERVETDGHPGVFGTLAS